MNIIEKIAEEFKLKVEQVEKTVELIDEGNTIPFIARYRKEVTGSLDDNILRDLNDRLNFLRNIEKRKQEVSDLITAQEKMTPEIQAAIDAAQTITEVDDIYRPFRPHRKTRASVAREKGLEPLAELIYAQNESYEPSIEVQAEAYIDEEKGVGSVEEALQGAKDIIAENVSDNAEFRKELRRLTFEFGILSTRQAKEEDSVYAQYYEYSEPLKKVLPHRVLAINRGEKEEFLKVDVTVASEIVLNYLFAEILLGNNSPAEKYVSAAILDSYDRLIAPSIEREIRNDIFDNASEGAIKVFADNLSHLLMASPLKGKTVLGFDPGYAHGCKLAVVDKTGKYLTSTVIYPTKPREDIARASQVLLGLIRKYNVDIIAIGNGTASRESEKFVANLIHENGLKVAYTIVSESGASVYSATKLAQEEFPDLDVNERSAVSIARRLQDPLAELVKVDPMAIGVGQYQHDMNPKRLAETLGGVVEDCVNSIGVDLNTASASLLSYVSGINKTIAKNIVAYREENGEFKSRAKLLKVPKLGAKAYEQCAGFLRVVGSDEILDNTGVHPESYPVAKALLSRFEYTEDDVRAGTLQLLRHKAEKAGFAKLASELGCGEPTLLDIIGELEKPGRDSRDDAPAPVLRTDVLEMKDLAPDMVLKGTVRNVVDFGAFIDIGVHEDGLLHISEMSDRFIKHPRELLAVGDVIEVKVKSVDMQRKRISLTRKGLSTQNK